MVKKGWFQLIAHLLFFCRFFFSRYFLLSLIRLDLIDFTYILTIFIVVWHQTISTILKYTMFFISSNHIN